MSVILAAAGLSRELTSFLFMWLVPVGNCRVCVLELWRLSIKLAGSVLTLVRTPSAQLDNNTYVAGNQNGVILVWLASEVNIMMCLTSEC